MREIDGNTYCFGDDARLLYGWISYGGGLYYSGQDGAVCKGETMIDGHTYCFDTVTGLLVTGWCENNGKRQYRLYDGTPASGILTVDGTEYLFDSKGYPTSEFSPTTATPCITPKKVLPTVLPLSEKTHIISRTG